MEIIKRSGLRISREYENENFYKEIKEFLTRRQKEYNTSTYITNVFYQESEKFLLIPRNFPLEKYTFGYKIKDISHEGEDIDIQHNITPRGMVQTRAINFMIKYNTGLLQLAPGVGKTVISICVIAERKKKTIILVHRDSLAEQWKNRVTEFTNLKKENISRLTSNTFEKDLEKPIIITTVQTILSLLKRKRKEFLIAVDKAKIGVLIADEVHTTIGAPSFSEASIHIPSKCAFGLSATPDRIDGNADIIEYHLGNIYKQDDTENTMDAKVTIVLIDYEIDTPKRATYLRWGGSFQRARYLNLMKKSKPFISAIKGLLVKFKDRDTICVSERIKLIELLYEWFPGESKAMFCGKGGLETLESKLTFGTPGKVRDGIDAPWKDTLLTTSPISNINQMSGRVIRKADGKKTPLVIDMVDYGCKMISNTFYKREKFYQDKNWPIQYLLFKNNKIIKIPPEDVHKIIRGE